MVFDYGELKAKIKEKYSTQENFARHIGISRTSLNLKLNNNVEFTQQEISKSVDILGVGIINIPRYFFTPKVQKTKQNILKYD